jgi:HSP20 family protein
MDLIKWNNFDDTFPQLPSIFGDFFGRESYGRNPLTGISLPAVNIKEDNDKFLVTLAIPGVKKEDCKVTIENGMLTVSSVKKNERNETKDSYSRHEYNFASFSRSFSLPENVDADSIQAKHEDGELKIELHKKEKSLPASKEIEIG